MGNFSNKASQFILSAITFTPRWGVGNDIEWFPSTRWGVENSSEPCKSTDNRTICHVPSVFAARWDGVKNGEGKNWAENRTKSHWRWLVPTRWVVGGRVEGFLGTRWGVGKGSGRFLGYTSRGRVSLQTFFLSHCFEVFHVGETRGVRPFAGRVCAMWKTTMTTFKGAAFASPGIGGLVGRIFYRLNRWQL